MLLRAPYQGGKGAEPLLEQNPGAGIYKSSECTARSPARKRLAPVLFHTALASFRFIFSRLAAERGTRLSCAEAARLHQQHSEQVALGKKKKECVVVSAERETGGQWLKVVAGQTNI